MKKLIIGILTAAMLILVLCPILSYAFFAEKPSGSLTARVNALIDSNQLAASEWADLIEDEHIVFQSINGGDRRSFFTNAYNPATNTGDKKGEQIAADYIVQRLSQMGYSEDADNGQQGLIILDYFSQMFTISSGSIFSKAQEEARWSQNVILRFDTASDRRVVVGASIDNNYKSSDDGAMLSGGSVALLLALAKHLYNNHQYLPFDLDIVFFGAGYFDGDACFLGGENYLNKHSAGISLMINVGKLGGDKTYIYTDEVKTLFEKYCLSLGDFNKLPSSLPLTSAGLQGGPNTFSYAHYGLKGNHSRFIENAITSVSFFYGNYGGITLSDNDSKLKSDTIAGMKAAYPSAYQNMAGTAEAISQMLSDGNLLQTVADSNADKFDYSIFMQKWVAYLILAAFILIGFVVLINISRRLVAKYPPASPSAPLKRAVFGEEYENKNNNNNDPFR